MKSLFSRLSLIALGHLAVAVLILAGCSPARVDPPLLAYGSPTVTLLSAQAHARDVGGRVYAVADTHSMEPTLRGGDLIVVQPVPFTALRIGQIITYRADWLPATSPPVTHRLVLRDSAGWVLSGDNNARSEPGSRVTAENYLGLVVGIYRTHA